MANLVQSLKDCLKNSADKTALVDYSTGRVVSYLELAERVSSVYELLSMQGIEQTEEVSIVSSNHLDQIASFIAILQYGASVNGFELSVERVEAEIARIENVQKNLSRQMIIMISTSHSKAEILLAALLCGAQVVMLQENISDQEFLMCLKRVRPHLINMNSTFAENIIRNNIYPSMNDAKMTHMMSLSHTRRMLYKQLRKHLMFCFGGCVQNVSVYGASPLSSDIESFLHRIEFPYRFILSRTNLSTPVSLS